MTYDLKTILKVYPLLTEADEPLIDLIARELYAGEDVKDFNAARQLSAASVSGYRSAVRAGPAKSIADELPVRKVVPAGDGGGRYYWRIAMDGGGVVSAVKDGNKGTIHDARRKAAELICLGCKPVELVPPDYDPQQHDPNVTEWTRNLSKQQPQGMTVRQRTKKV